MKPLFSTPEQKRLIIDDLLSRLVLDLIVLGVFLGEEGEKGNGAHERNEAIDELNLLPVVGEMQESIGHRVEYEKAEREAEWNGHRGHDMLGALRWVVQTRHYRAEYERYARADAEWDRVG